MAALLGMAAVLAGLPAAAQEVARFGLFRLSREGAGIISGQAAPGSPVQILDWGQPIAALTADRHGAWVHVAAAPMNAGVHLLGLAGAPAAVALYLPKRGLGGFFEASEDAVLAVALPEHKGEDSAAEVLQRPGSMETPIGSRGLGFDTIDYDPAGNLTITGRGASQAEIRVYIDNQPVCRPTADAAGIWRCRTAALTVTANTSQKSVKPDARHILRADQMTGGGGVYGRIEQDFSRQILSDRTFANGLVAIKPGRAIWQISRKLPGNQRADTLVVLAGKNQVKDAGIVYPGQIMEKGR